MKSPGGDLTFFSLLSMLAGGVLAYDYFSRGNTLMGTVMSLMGVASLLLWFQIRAAKYVLIVYWSIAIAGGVMILVGQGFSAWRLVKMLVSAMIIHSLWKWDPDD
jgi:hypothetical protein